MLWVGEPSVPNVEIHPDELTNEPIRRLLALRLASIHASSLPGSVFALDLSGLTVPGSRD